MAVIDRLAARAPVPVFAVAGGGARDAVQDLLLEPDVTLVATPRRALVLLVAGRLPRTLLRRVALVHDQLPHPRATVWWTSGDRAELAGTFGETAVDGTARDAAAAIVATGRRLLTERHASDPGVLPSVPPRPWRGVGPHGQGGMGMMGGHPYGRPMAMTGPDRDGLQLDRVPVVVGPFLPGFPPGLALDLVVQGDVIQEVEVRDDPFAASEPFPGPAGGPVRARAIDPHVRHVARVLDHHGLRARAARLLRLAADGGRIDRPAARIRRDRSVRWATTGVGRVPDDALADAPEEVRRFLAGDARDRLCARLDAIGDPDPAPAVTRTALPLLPELLPGLEWGDAVTTIVSLGLDLEAATDRHATAA